MAFHRRAGVSAFGVADKRERNLPRGAGRSAERMLARRKCYYFALIFLSFPASLIWAVCDFFFASCSAAALDKPRNLAHVFTDNFLTRDQFRRCSMTLTNGRGLAPGRRAISAAIFMTQSARLIKARCRRRVPNRVSLREWLRDNQFYFPGQG